MPATTAIPTSSVNRSAPPSGPRPMLPRKPSMKPLDSVRIGSGNGPMPWLPSTVRVSARKSSIPASVTMNAGMPKYATQNPCQWPRHLEVDHQHRGQRSGDRHDRTGRQIDVPRDDDQNHPDREDQDVGV